MFYVCFCHNSTKTVRKLQYKRQPVFALSDAINRADELGKDENGFWYVTDDKGIMQYWALQTEGK